MLGVLVAAASGSLWSRLFARHDTLPSLSHTHGKMPKRCPLIRNGTDGHGMWSFSKWECVMQPLHSACASAPHARAETCVPIEPLGDVDPRKRLWRLEQQMTADEFASLFEREFVYKSLVTSRPEAFAGRAIYIDVGANTYASSIGDWFLKRYPSARKFHLIAFEGEPQHFASYEGTGVELVKQPVWTRNTTIAWVTRGHTRRTTAQRQVVTGTGIADVGGNGNTMQQSTRVTINLAEFLQRRVVAADFVVMKMDIEGAEYTVIPHLLNTGAAALIDELFMETHTNLNDCCKQYRRSDAVKLLTSLRKAGVYAHDWV